MSNASTPAVALRWRWVLPALALLALVQFTALGRISDLAFFDAFSRKPLRNVPPPEGSALVLFDDATLDALRKADLEGNWPPPRATFAALIAGLERAGAARIVLDLVFLDRSSAAEQDQLLGSVAAAFPNVVLARTAKDAPIVWNAAFIAAHPDLFSQPRTGHVDPIVDDDGVLRRYAVADSLAAVAAGRLDAPVAAMLRWHGGLETLRASGRVPALSAHPFVLSGMTALSEAISLEPDLQPARLAAVLREQPQLHGGSFNAVRGRVVFVGANAAGTFDNKPFPIGGLEPGVLSHWTAWANLVHSGFIRPLSPWLSLVLAVTFLSAVAWGAGAGNSLLWPTAAAVLLAAGTLAVSYAGMSWGWFLAPTTPLVAATLSLGGVAAENFWRERRRRREVQAIFGSYVAPEVVDLLVRDPHALELGGERREATVFFCDLAGFTRLSEHVAPEELLKIVNRYLHDTSEVLLQHGAYIDKYIGDAVMAVFGAPMPQHDHALAACRGALAVQRALRLHNADLLARQLPPLELRIGINTGEMIVGNVGSPRKKNYTVLGDAVNLASRLEGANKEFGTYNLISEHTARSVEPHLVLRPLAALRVKGKDKAVRVYELIGERTDLAEPRRAFLSEYNLGYARYEQRDFTGAAAAFTAAAELDAHDAATARLLADSRRLAANPPPAEWQPILSLTSK